MSVLHGKDSDGESRAFKVAPDGTLATSATVEIPAGGATSAKQDTGNASLASVDGKLPAALTAGGGVKTGLVDAIPAGANTIGAVTGPSAAALALDASLTTLNNTLVALSAKLTAAALATGTLVTPTTTMVMALLCGYNSGLGRPLLEPVSSTGVRSVFTTPITPAGRSASLTALQVQRSVGFGCTPRSVHVWSKDAGDIAFFNSASAVANGAVPYGGRSYPIGAGEHLEIPFSFAESFGTGFTVCHCTALDDGAGNGTVTISTVASCRYTILYD